MKTKITSPLELFQKTQDESIEVFFMDEKVYCIGGFLSTATIPILRYVCHDFSGGRYTWQPKKKTLEQYEAEIKIIKEKLEYAMQLNEKNIHFAKEQYEAEIAELKNKVITREGFFEGQEELEKLKADNATLLEENRQLKEDLNEQRKYQN